MHPNSIRVTARRGRRSFQTTILANLLAETLSNSHKVPRSYSANTPLPMRLSTASVCLLGLRCWFTVTPDVKNAATLKTRKLLQSATHHPQQMSPPLIRRSLCFVDDKEFHSSQALLLKRPIRDSTSSNAGSSHSNLSAPTPGVSSGGGFLLHSLASRSLGHVPKTKLGGSRSSDAPSSDVPELQDDSFVNFSVGHLSRQHSSVLNMARYARALARADDECSDDGFSRRRVPRKQRRFHAPRNGKYRERYSGHCDRFGWLGPVKRCFYYWKTNIWGVLLAEIWFRCIRISGLLCD